MKKILYSFLILAFISCSNDSVSDITETNNSEENNNDDNNNSGNNTVKITFTTDIAPLIQSKCSSCHVSGGSQEDYTVYNNAKNKASTIINRINRSQGSGGFMPQNGIKLSATELAKFDQWITDGKLE